MTSLQVDFKPLYTGDGNATSNGHGSHASLLPLLQQALFESPGLSAVVGGDPAECSVLLAGVSGEVASIVCRDLASRRVARERMLFCDFF